MNKKIGKIYFNPDEVRAIGMGIARVIDNLEQIRKGQHVDIPWIAETPNQFGVILATSRSVAHKFEKFARYKCEPPPYNSLDENEFLTKES